MIRAVVSAKDNNYSEFTCTGHAGFSKHGKDIVCAAVSTLVINTGNALEKLTDADITVTETKDEIRFIFNSIPDDKAKLLMDTMILGLNGIQKEYGRKYLDLVIK